MPPLELSAAAAGALPRQVFKTRKHGRETRRTNKDCPEVQPWPYRLTPEGLASVRSSAKQNRPWEQSMGPRTAERNASSSKHA